MHLGLFVYPDAFINSKAIAPIDLIIYTRSIMPVGRPSKMIRIIYLWILHHWEIEQNTL